MPVGEYCNREVVITDKDTSIREAARLMREHHVGDLIVVEPRENQNIPLGIVTDRDLVVEVLATEVSPEAVSVGDIMSFELTTVREEESLWDALDCMRRAGVRRMPVVNENGGLAGIVTADDVLELLAEGLTDFVKIVKRERQREAVQRK
jgi:CBS domain-containing protein